MNNMANGNNEGAAILGIIVLIGAIIIFAREVLVPFFGIILIISFIGLVASLFLQHKEMLIVFGITFLVCLLGFGTSYAIGYGLGGTSMGQMAVETHDAVAMAEEEVETAIDSVIETTIEDLCKTSSEEVCNSLIINKQLFKTAQEVRSMADKLSKVKAVTDN